MNWAAGELLYGLWGLPVLAILLWLALRARRRALARLGALLSGRSGPDAQRIHRQRAVLLLAAIGLCVVALARPQWGFRWQEQRSEGVSLVVVLDVSRSMDAEDVSPSRMERARREVWDLAELLAGDRVGLVLAAGGAHPQMFLTLDYDTFARMTRQASTATLRAQGSDLGAAIDKSVELLDGSEGDRAILLISDGEDQIGEAVAAAKRAAELGIRLYTLGVGTPEGAPIPLPGGGFQKDGGDVVISRLDEDTLRDIAEAGSGAYVRSVAGASDIRAIYLDEIRGKLSGAEQGVRREKIWTERYQWFLAAGLLLLLIGHALRPGPLRLRGAGLVLLLALPGVSRADGTEIDRLIQEQVHHPDDLDLAERLGAALLKEGRFQEAAEVLDGVADRSLDSEQRGRARYNAGLAEYGAGRLTAAVEDWQRVLTDNPGHGPAKQNAEAVQAEINARMQEEPPPEDSQDGDPQDGDPQDGDSQDGQQSQDGSPQDSQQSQDGDPQDSQPQDDGTTNPDNSQPLSEAGDTGQSAGGEPRDGELGEDAAGQASAGQEGEISEDAAMRLLGGVEEGEPRVEITPESRGGKDW
jgi:Ca-activated chloride channel family protein